MNQAQPQVPAPQPAFAPAAFFFAEALGFSSALAGAAVGVSLATTFESGVAGAGESVAAAGAGVSVAGLASLAAAAGVSVAGAVAAGTSFALAGLSAGGVEPPQAMRPVALSAARVAAIELKLSCCDIEGSPWRDADEQPRR
jgi:hypothetical protein